MNSFSALGPLQYAGIGLAGIVLTALVLFFLLREQKSIKALDGTLFSSDEACLAYEAACKRFEKLYSQSDKNSSSANLGFQTEFLKLLKKDGFVDVKTLLAFRDDFNKLVAMFNDELIKEEQT